MPADNLFEELKSALSEFKGFLDTNVPVIKPAIQAVAGVIPQVNDLLTQLAALLGSLKTEVQNLDVAGIPGLSEVAQFTSMTSNLLTAAKNLLPGAADEIEAVENVASVVTSLPELDEVKGEILSLLDAVIAHVNSLKA